MQSSEDLLSAKSHWRQVAEGLTIAGSLGGVVATAITNQVIYASAPLALAVLFNRLNRHYDWQDCQQHQTQLVTQFDQSEQQFQHELTTLDARLVQAQHSMAEQQQRIEQLQDTTQLLGANQQQLETLARNLQEFEIHSQAIRCQPDQVDALYQRGLVAHQLGAFQGAVGDFTEAIRLNGTFAAAYQHRALALTALGERQAAVADLRVAARHFFDQGDITNYQNSRNLSKMLHQGAEAEAKLEVQVAGEAQAELQTPDLSLTQECLLV